MGTTIHRKRKRMNMKKEETRKQKQGSGRITKKKINEKKE
jgi:hypothetical protein